MKGKKNSKSTNKSPNKNLKQDEMKKNPILPNKKGNGKKDVVKEEPKPKKIELPIIENNQINFLLVIHFCKVEQLGTYMHQAYLLFLI